MPCNRLSLVIILPRDVTRHKYLSLAKFTYNRDLAAQLNIILPCLLNKSNITSKNENAQHWKRFESTTGTSLSLQSNYNKVIQDAKLSLVQFGLDIKLRSKLY